MLTQWGGVLAVHYPFLFQRNYFVSVVHSPFRSLTISLRLLTYTFTIEGPSRVLDITNSISLNLYPNPVSELLTIEWDKNTLLESIHIFQINGRVLYQNSQKYNSGKESINVNAFLSGTYIVKVSTDDGVAIRKFVKI